jgi:hypothetical protein
VLKVQCTSVLCDKGKEAIKASGQGHGDRCGQLRREYGKWIWSEGSRQGSLDTWYT